MTIDGLDLLAAIAAVAILLLAVDLYVWKRRDTERRFQRQVSRNLRRATGGRTWNDANQLKG